MDGRNGSHASVVVERRIDWADTDLAGICHYPAFARLADAAESYLYDRLDLMDAFLRLPRVAVNVDFITPLRFNDVVAVHFRIGRVGASSVTGKFSIVRDGESTVRGEVVSALLDEDGRKAEWPLEWRRRLLESGPIGREALAYPATAQ
jgi:acyl-CoA thioesterase FadM